MESLRRVRKQSAAATSLPSNQEPVSQLINSEDDFAPKRPPECDCRRVFQNRLIGLDRRF